MKAGDKAGEVSKDMPVWLGSLKRTLMATGQKILSKTVNDMTRLMFQKNHARCTLQERKARRLGTLSKAVRVKMGKGEWFFIFY